ncbi:MAG: hypothetical protein J6Y72_07060 [Bacteroidales bacterium]|nr:hypothetical protein [Bacteroidales bacterium]
MDNQRIIDNEIAYWRHKKVYRETFDGIRQLMKDRQWTKYVAYDSCDHDIYNHDSKYEIKTDKYYVRINLTATYLYEDWCFSIFLCNSDDQQKQRKNLKLLADKILTEIDVNAKDVAVSEDDILIEIREDKDLMPTIEKVFTIMFE